MTGLLTTTKNFYLYQSKRFPIIVLGLSFLPAILSSGTVVADHSERTSVFLDFHRACPGWDHNWPATTQPGRSSPRLSFRLAPRVGRKVWENSWSGLSVAGQLSPRWDKPSGSGMWQEFLRAENTEIVFRQFAELILDSSPNSIADRVTAVAAIRQLR